MKEWSECWEALTAACKRHAHTPRLREVPLLQRLNQVELAQSVAMSKRSNLGSWQVKHRVEGQDRHMDSKANSTPRQTHGPAQTAATDMVRHKRSHHNLQHILLKSPTAWPTFVAISVFSAFFWLMWMLGWLEVELRSALLWCPYLFGPLK